MNTNDFIVLPKGKTGNSVKLKAKNTRELQVEKVKLELENVEMEKKLQQLQASMSREKEERESSGYHWKSGQAIQSGYQSQRQLQNKENFVKISSGKVKLKALKETSQETEKESYDYKMASDSVLEKSKTRGKACGQCEIKTAQLVCLECGEDYCVSCFAKIHQKGALKFHRTTLLQTKSHVPFSKLDVEHQFLKDVNSDASKVKHDLRKDISNTQLPSQTLLQTNSSQIDTPALGRTEFANQKGGLLLQGSFDEDESAKSFQEILTHWRTGNYGQKEREKNYSQEAKADPKAACEVQTNLKILREPLEIEFQGNSLSYMEKLWLKKYRSSPPVNVPNKFRQPQTSPEEPDCILNGKDNIKAEEMQFHQTANSLREDTDIERLEESCVNIVEVNDTYEEELKGEESFVPYRVEIAESNSQCSWRVPEYQKNGFHFGAPLWLSTHLSVDCLYSALIKEKTDPFTLCSGTDPLPCKEIHKVSAAKTFPDELQKRANADVLSTNTEEMVPSNPSDRYLRQKKSNKVEHDAFLGSSLTPERTSYLFNTDFDPSSSRSRTYQNTEEYLKFSNLKDSANVEIPELSKPSKVLQEIALRRKPVSDQYQGLERFFLAGATSVKGRTSPFLSGGSECCSPNTTITFTGNGQWISGSSLSEFADESVVQSVLLSAPSEPSRRIQPKMGPPSRRPTSTNLPPVKTPQRNRDHFKSFHPEPRSVSAQPLSRAASEISEIESIDLTDQNDPLLENATDQQTLDSLEKELGVLKNLADPLGELYSLPYEEISAFNIQLEKMSKTVTDVHITSGIKDPCRVDTPSYLGEKNESPTLLSSPESDKDDDEELLEDKQQVMGLH
ncbi:zinc finger B-box domain-containing protein 1 isoform X1 [Ornithorhynchus anatinus]|uniref:Zinc finger B-box domain containing n=1 Tax=Ornithorhynchus anatinus TaxID=9258 RepID=F7EVF0_ORNAN|nr:zinc finger B-box domain-containing protein 1 isoform X1 [Ornithorhynchus anatinus]XP_039769208.1 zinc finger B-box domain-containing protein 1 isoform X1 [Ornithorhynchus anatinus]